MLRLSRGDRGFTLVETLASLVVFSLVTLGLVPLMLSATRASALSRSFTVGKNVAVEAMERARGLPFYVSRGVQNNNVDFLDLYHPAPPNSSAFYQIACNSTSTDLGCPKGLPDSYRITFRTRFVSVAEDGTLSTVGSTGYSALDETLDTPPSRLTQFVVVANWVLGDRTRTYQIESLIGDRKFGGAETNGFGRVNYAVRVSTSYDDAGNVASLAGSVGAAESRIETRRDSTATQAVTAAVLRLLDPSDEDVDLVAPVEGAALTVEAPPDFDPPPTPGDAGVLIHPDTGLEVAGINASTAGSTGTPMDVKVVANNLLLPAAQGGYTLDGSEDFDLWVDKPEAERGALSSLRLLDATIDGSEILSLPSITDTEDLEFLGYTSAITTPLPGGAVTTAAHVEVDAVNLFPTVFAPEGVVQIRDFQADVECVGKAEGVSASTDAQWSATIFYWSADAAGGTGGYVEPGVSVSSSPTDEGVLAEIEATNPVVFRDTSGPILDGSSPGDIHLFPQTHEHVDPATGETVTHNHAGYLQAWRSNQEVSEEIGTDGRTARAGIVDALSVDTVPVPATGTFRATPLSISLGALGCEAVDFR